MVKVLASIGMLLTYTAAISAANTRLTRYI